MKTVSVLVLLLLMALASIAWQKHQRELAEQAQASAERQLGDANAVLAELRSLRADVSAIDNAIKTLGDKRSANGEKRRETIKTALDSDRCAVAPVPAAVADSLQKRAAEVRAADYSRAFAGQPDGQH